MLRRCRHFVGPAVFLISVAGLFSIASTEAQWVRRDWGAYGSPATALSAQILAQAEEIRALGEFNRNTAEALEIRAKARKQEIINSIEIVKAYFARQHINEAERLKKFLENSQSERMKRQIAKTWERLQYLPELGGAETENGTALNFLLNRLGGSVLAHQMSLGAGPSEFENLPALRLEPAILHRLRLRRKLANGSELVFIADQGVPAQTEWWPFILNGDKFAAHRRKYDEARRDAIDAARKKQDNRAEIGRLIQAYEEFTTAFRKINTRENRMQAGQKSIAEYHEFRVAERFLQDRAREVMLLKDVGPRISEDELTFQGKDLFALLTHMSHNGLEFAPPLPGHESAYRNVCKKMIDMYAAVADDEPATAAK